GAKALRQRIEHLHDAVARQPRGEQVNVGEFQADEPELHFAMPAREAQKPVERTGEVLRMSLAELVHEFEQIPYLAGARGQLARRGQAQPVVAALGELVGAGQLVALQTTRFQLGLREASTAALAGKRLQGAIVIDADVAQPGGAFRAAEPALREVLFLGTDVAARVAMQEVLLDGVDAAALRTGLDEQQLSGGAARTGMH